MVNEQFQAAATAIYALAGFKRRVKGQRWPRYELPLMSLESLEQGYTAELLGSSPGYGVHGEELMYDKFVVTTPQGQRIPCYRRRSDSGCFLLCVDFNYVA